MLKVSPVNIGLSRLNFGKKCVSKNENVSQDRNKPDNNKNVKVVLCTVPAALALASVVALGNPGRNGHDIQAELDKYQVEDTVNENEQVYNGQECPRGRMGLRGDVKYRKRDAEDPLVADKFILDKGYICNVIERDGHFIAQYSDGTELNCDEIAKEYKRDPVCGDDGVDARTGIKGKTLEEYTADDVLAAIAAAEFDQEPVKSDCSGDDRGIR